jgi:putative ABC transport system permease protein
VQVKNRFLRRYRILLRLYPKRFRELYGDEAMLQLQADMKETRAFAKVTCVVEFLFAGVAERAHYIARTTKSKTEQRKGSIMSSLAQDVRYAARGFLKQPGFAIVAVVSLALGIGANTAIFSVVNGVLLRPLPYDEPERVVQIVGTLQGELVRRHSWLAYPEIEDIREASGALEHVSAFQWWSPIMYGDGEPTRLSGQGVSANYFEIFGLQPTAGRFFLTEDEVLGHEPVVVLSHAFWQQRFGGDANVVGTTLDLDGTNYLIVGVAPDHFVDPFGDQPQIWRSRPPGWDVTRLARINHSWRAIGRLADDVTLQQAQAELDLIWNGFREEYPDSHSEDGAVLVGAKDWMVGNVRTAILVLLGAVGLVLLIACGNVANLFLTRTVTRGREVALRAAIGASQGRIVRQLVTEVGLLFVAGGTLGFGLAWIGKDLLLSMGSQNLPRMSETQIDLPILGFTLVVSLVCGLVFGLTAAYPIARKDLASTLQSGGRTTSGDWRSQKVRGALVVSEVALALVLLVGGGLLLRSLWNLQNVEPGFQPENVLTMRVYPRAGTFGEHEEVTSLYEQVTQRVSAIPSVTAAGAANFIPMSSGQNCEFVWPDDRPIPSRQEFATMIEPRCLEVRVVTPDYFQALGIPVIRGRALTEQDREADTPVALINQTTANLMFRDEDPLDQRLTLYETRDYLPDVSRTIVGVVGDVRQVGLAADPVPAIYMAHIQEPDPGRRRVMTLLIRTERDPTDVAELARAAVRQVDGGISIDFVQTMTAVVNRTTAQPRFRTNLVLLFGGIALVLAMVGVAGVVGYAVSQQIPEIGLRMALGAQSRDIYSMVMGHGIKLTAMGVVVGLTGGYATTRVMSGLLFGVSAVDPVSFFGAAAVLTLVAVVAVWIPARKALRVDPVVVLDSE